MVSGEDLAPWASVVGAGVALVSMFASALSASRSKTSKEEAAQAKADAEEAARQAGEKLAAMQKLADAADRQAGHTETIASTLSASLGPKQGDPAWRATCTMIGPWRQYRLRNMGEVEAFAIDLEGEGMFWGDDGKTGSPPGHLEPGEVTPFWVRRPSKGGWPQSVRITSRGYNPVDVMLPDRDGKDSPVVIPGRR